MIEEHQGASRDLPPQRFFVLDDLVVDTVRNLILRDGEVIKLEPKVMKVLVYLAQARGEIVSRRELMERVWGVQVVDEAIQRSISLLRVALGDGRGRPRLETVPRKGYRLLLEPEDLILRTGPEPRHRVNPLATAFALGAVITLLLLALVSPQQVGPSVAPEAPPPSTDSRPSVAPPAPR